MLNATLLVKFIKSGKKHLIESLAVAEHLEKLHVDINKRRRHLLPEDEMDRFEVLRLCEVISSD